MTDPQHVTTAELEAGLDEIRRAPKDGGLLELIARRPGTGMREILEEGELDLAEGLVGDRWSSRTDGRSPNPNAQLTLMSSRAAALVAGRENAGPLPATSSTSTWT